MNPITNKYLAMIQKKNEHDSRSRRRKHTEQNELVVIRKMQKLQKIMKRKK